MRYFVIVLVGVIRRLLPLMVLFVCIAVAAPHIRNFDWTATQHALLTIPPQNWVMALIATTGSFACLAQYDLLAHRVLNTGTGNKDARIAGLSAIGISQCTGFGPVVAGAVRYRILSNRSARDVLRVTAWVSASFLLSWAVIALCFAVPVSRGHAWISIPASLGVAALWATIIICAPDPILFGRKFTLPSLSISARMLTLTCADLICAAAALWLLLPDAPMTGFAAVFAAYTLALGCGLLAGTPGGAGPFDMVLITALPFQENSAVLAGLLGFRLVYYVLPGLVGLGLFAFYRAGAQADAPFKDQPLSRNDVSHPEHAIAVQSGAILLMQTTTSLAALVTRNTLSAFRKPVTGDLTSGLPAFHDRARVMGKIPCLYKISARDATQARKVGWAVLPIAREAVIHTDRFTLDGSDKRQLRRQLRKVQKSGIVTGIISDPDWNAIDAVHSNWLTQNGREKGLTMGRYSREYLSDKVLFGAWQNGKLIAFVSCVDTHDCLSLDVMRRTKSCPAGTMHALVLAIINAASCERIPVVSLAAVPTGQLRRFDRNSRDLTRFKQAFAPQWRRLYFSAPTVWHMAWAALDLRVNILRPPKLVEDAAMKHASATWIKPGSYATNTPARIQDVERKAG